MIITDPLYSRMTVDLVYANNAAALEDVAEQLGKRIIREGENVGAFIRRDSIWVRKLPPHTDRPSFDVEALWSPDPSAGVHLQGGPNDGRVITLRREQDGRPIDLLRIPAEPTMPDVADSPAFLDPVADYERVGIDSERDVWVYKYRGQR